MKKYPRENLRNKTENPQPVNRLWINKKAK